MSVFAADVLRRWHRSWSDDPLSTSRVKIIQGLAPMAIPLLSPFAILHLLQGLWVLGGTIAAAQLLLLWIWLRLRRGETASRLTFFLVVLNNLIIVLTLHEQGVIVVPWVSVALVSNYFLLPRRQAHTVCMLMLVVAVWTFGTVTDARHALRLAAASLLLLWMLNIVLAALSQAQGRLTELAEIDSLTSVGNRRRFDRVMAQFTSLDRHLQRPGVLLAIDIDHFKSVNDNFGHAVGDEVLKAVAHRIRGRLRESDQMFRTGGEEFAVLLNRTGSPEGGLVAQDLLTLFSEREIIDGIVITVSIGLSERSPGTGVAEWIRAADAALYEAKRRGRNQVVQAA